MLAIFKSSGTNWYVTNKLKREHKIGHIAGSIFIQNINGILSGAEFEFREVIAHFIISSLNPLKGSVNKGSGLDVRDVEKFEAK